MNHLTFLTYLTDFLDYLTDVPSTERRQRRVIEAANGGMQEMVSLAPPGMFSDRRGVLLREPATFSAEAMEAGNDLTDFTMPSFGEDAGGAWMRASTCRVDGDGYDHEVRCAKQGAVVATGTITSTIEYPNTFFDTGADFLRDFGSAEASVWVEIDHGGSTTTFHAYLLGKTYVIANPPGAWEETITPAMVGDTYRVVAAVNEPDWASISPTRLELVRPYAGTTGSKNVTVWDDAVVLDADVMEVVGHVVCNGRILQPVNGRRTLYANGATTAQGQVRDYGLTNGAWSPNVVAVRRTGPPLAYTTEYYTEDNDLTPRLMLFLDSLPTEKTRLDFEVKKLPAVFSLSSFLADQDGERPVGMPYDAIESVAIPICVQRLVKDLDFTMVRDEVAEKSENIMAEAYRAYVEAREILETWEPRVRSNVQLIPGF